MYSPKFLFAKFTPAGGKILERVDEDSNSTFRKSGAGNVGVGEKQS